MILAASMNPESYSTVENAIVRLKRGDVDALTEILTRYQPRLYGYLFRMVQDPALADDLFQQTWLRVMEKIGSYNSSSRFDSWLISVAHNLAIDHIRRQRSHSLDVPDEDGATEADRLRSSGPDPLAALLDSERAVLIAAAMDELPAIHREVLTLRFETGMKLEEIADIAAIPLSTVKSRLHRALDGLRAGVEKRFGR
jgi:RNA polymerase sigma-70 factor (ECF subfamily)